jgi:DNA-binding NarL/FixJ family response regulator
MTRLPKLLLIENDRFLSALLSFVLEKEGFSILGSSSDVGEINRVIMTEKPDVVLVCENLSFIESIIPTLIKMRVLFPNVGIIFCSNQTDFRFAGIPSRLLATSVYLPKRKIKDIGILVEAILRSQLVSHTPERKKNESNLPEELQKLTPTDVVLLRAIFKGKSNKAIAEEKFIATKSVENSISRLAKRLGVSESAHHNKRIMLLRRYLELSGGFN